MCLPSDPEVSQPWQLPTPTLSRFTRLPPGLARAQLSLQTQMLDTPRDAYIFPKLSEANTHSCSSRPLPAPSLLTGLRCRGRSRAKPTSRQLPELDLMGNVPKETPGHARRCQWGIPTLPTSSQSAGHTTLRPAGRNQK